MKYWPLLVLALMPHYRCAHADVPPCFPGFLEPNVERIYPYIVVDDKENCAAVWFCPRNHKWDRYSIYGHGDNIDNCAYPHAKAVAALFMTRDQKIAAWKERFVDGVETDPVKQAQYQAQDQPARDLAMSVPTPMTIPPDGLVTQETKAYRLNRVANSTPTFTPVGSVALGVPCDPASLNGYHRIDVAAVKVPAKVLKPLEAFGKCDP